MRTFAHKHLDVLVSFFLSIFLTFCIANDLFDK